MVDFIFEIVVLNDVDVVVLCVFWKEFVILFGEGLIGVFEVVEVWWGIVECVFRVDFIVVFRMLFGILKGLVILGEDVVIFLFFVWIVWLVLYLYLIKLICLLLV